ncbi:sensor histidine kinase [Nocardia sp. NPDC127526]|uniref:sensor histidine kinase n=1 Tax=Nocardia sp. NPDC127526 TaxID=3345393 RepID=UPI00363780E0
MDSTGMTRGVDWLLDARSLPVRMIVLTVLAVGCQLLLVDSPSGADWAIALASIAATAGGVRWPLVTALVTTALLLIGFEFGDAGPLVPKVAAGIALTELAARRGGAQPLVGAAALGGAYLFHSTGSAAATGYRAIVMAGVPLVLGWLLRTAREAVHTARREAAEITQRRHAEVAAARAWERTAIARELHDLIAHHVSSTVLRVGVAQLALPDAPLEVREVLDDVHTSGVQTLADLRKLVTILRDPQATGESFIAPTDLPEALHAAVERARVLGLRVETNIDGEITAVDAMTALTLLRLTQEGLANIAKHAGVDANARLGITAGTDGVSFELRDRGGNPRTNSRGSKRAGSTGLGLIGLRERVALLGGTLTAASQDVGWRLAAHLPVEPRESL